MSTLRTTNIKHESSSSNNITLDTGGNISIAGVVTATTFSGALSGTVNSTGVSTVSSLNVTEVTTVSAGSASAPSITPSGDSNTGIFFPAADTIAFAEGGAEVLRINSSANVGIGSTNPSQKLDVNGNINLVSSGNYIQKTFNDETEEYILRGPSLSGFYPTISWRRSTGTATRGFIFGTHNNLGTRSDWMSIWDGSVGIGNTNPQAKLHVSGGNIKVDSGYGIDFSATANSSGTMTSELLSDYEEGSWTPTLEATGSNPTGVSYISQNASYIKVGRKVTCRFYFAFSTFTGGTGTPCIGGLPFASGSAANTYSEFALPYVTFVTYPAGTTSLGLELSPNGTKLAIFGVGSGLGGYQLLAFGTHISSSANGKLLLAVITYFTD